MYNTVGELYCLIDGYTPFKLRTIYMFVLLVVSAVRNRDIWFLDLAFMAMFKLFVYNRYRAWMVIFCVDFYLYCAA